MKATIPGVEVIDTPGLCDPDMEIPIWTEKYNKQMSSKPGMRDVSLVVFIIPPQSRVSANEKILAAVADEAFQSIKSKNMVLVVNKAPKNYTAAKALTNYTKMRESVKNCSLPVLTEDRILILPEVDYEPQEKGDIQPTIALSKQFKQFLESKIPKDSQTITAKKANVSSITEKVADKAVKEEMERMIATFKEEKASIMAEADKRI